MKRKILLISFFAVMLITLLPNIAMADEGTGLENIGGDYLKKAKSILKSKEAYLVYCSDDGKIYKEQFLKYSDRVPSSEREFVLATTRNDGGGFKTGDTLRLYLFCEEFLIGRGDR